MNAAGHEGKRLAILETAARLFKEHGFHRVGISDIAAALNVTKPSIYYYVGNKEEMLVRIRQLAAARLSEGLPELFASDRTGIELLEHVLLRYGEWATSDVGQCALRLIRTQLSPKNAAKLREVERSFEHQVKLIFDRGMADGTIKPCNPSMVQMVLFGALNWLAFWYDPERASLDKNEISRLFAEVLLQGIAGERTSSRVPLSPLTAGLRPSETTR
ncbi:TetR/AcrR family transcriptional regulator [Rhodoligotrophos defluvii]|uniref:TetR/AcrR family transcriptional regulator n=1 Tax=Rhodoligotrophos defluvii TaxID=2561934 RepID=UPI001485963A|nr:TetR/AcrR family transcriptional regulator [Rhodoligotrophos defluvii]